MSHLDMSGEEATQLAVGTFKAVFFCFLFFSCGRGKK